MQYVFSIPEIKENGLHFSVVTCVKTHWKITSVVSDREVELATIQMLLNMATTLKPSVSSTRSAVALSEVIAEEGRKQFPMMTVDHYSRGDVQARVLVKVLNSFCHDNVILSFSW